MGDYHREDRKTRRKINKRNWEWKLGYLLFLRMEYNQFKEKKYIKIFLLKSSKTDVGKQVTTATWQFSCMIRYRTFVSTSLLIECCNVHNCFQLHKQFHCVRFYFSYTHTSRKQPPRERHIFIVLWIYTSIWHEITFNQWRIYCVES